VLKLKKISGVKGLNHFFDHKSFCYFPIFLLSTKYLLIQFEARTHNSRHRINPVTFQENNISNVNL